MELSERRHDPSLHLGGSLIGHKALVSPSPGHDESKHLKEQSHRCPQGQINNNFWVLAREGSWWKKN